MTSGAERLDARLESLLFSLDELLAEHFADEAGDRPWPTALLRGLTDAEAVAWKRQPTHLLRAAMLARPLPGAMMADANLIIDAIESRVELNDQQTERFEATIEALRRAWGLEDATEFTTLSSSTLGGASIRVFAPQTVSLNLAATASPIRAHIEVAAGSVDARQAQLDVALIADGIRLTMPMRDDVSLSPGEKTRLNTHELAFDSSSIWALDRVTRGVLQARLLDGEGGVIAEASAGLDVLPPRAWHEFDRTLEPWETLAAHVQPHSPAVQQLIPAVQAKLRAHTGNGSIDNYQSGDATRVDAIARAAFEALRDWQLGYAEAPASWDVRGQLVRTPDEVSATRLATCMDSTVLLASLLEALGVMPLLVGFPDHILVAYWRVKGNAPSSAVRAHDLPALLTSEVGLVETTMVCSSAGAVSFTTATEAARAKVESSLPAGIDAIVDVHVARRLGVRAMPARVLLPDGSVTVIEYTAEVSSQRIEFQGASQARRTSAPSRVERWKSSLLDLSLRNRLINFSPRSQTRLVVPADGLSRLEDGLNANAVVPITHDRDFDPVLQDRIGRLQRQQDFEGSAAEIRKAIARRFDERMTVFVKLPRTPDEGPNPVTTFTTKMRRLTSEAQRVEREQGTNNLYVCFGMLRWNLGGKPLESPLILVPVHLTSTHRGTKFRLQLDESGASTPNFALLEKLKTEFDLDLPGLADPKADESGIDLEALFASVRESIAQRGLGFAVDEVAVLGLLAFGTYRLWKDVADHWEQFAATPLVRHLIHTPTEAFEDPVPARAGTDLDDLGLRTPIPADGSQLEAIADAVHGTTFVLEGPPGTGKSQTIVNLVAHAMMEGKRVLFVAEKADALEVVDQRLRASGLDALTLNLHHDDAKPKQVKEALLAALDLAPEFDADGLATRGESARASQRVLQRYARALHEQNAAGHSMYSAHNRVLASREVGDAAVPFADAVAAVPAERIQQVRQVLASAGEAMVAARPRPDHPWSFINHPVADIASVGRASVALDSALLASRAAPELHSYLLTSASLADRQLWLGVQHAPPWHPETLSAWASSDALQMVEQLRSDVAQFVGRERRWFRELRPETLDQDLLGWHAAAEAAGRGNPFTRKRRQREAAEALSPWLRPGESMNEATFGSKLQELMLDRSQLEHLRDRLRQLPLSAGAATANPLMAAHGEHLAVELKLLAERLRILLEAGRSAGAAAVIAAARRGRLHEEARLASAVLEAWNEVQRTLAPATDGVTTLQAWESLRLGGSAPISAGAIEWNDLLLAIDPLASPPFDDLRARILSGKEDPDAIVLAFDHGVAAASARERFEAMRMDSFDRATHHAAIDRFVASTEAIRGMLPQRIPAAVVEHRTFHGGARSGRIGELRRKLGKQRGGDTIREIFASHGDLITQIAPCVLTSPDGAARFLPPNAELFDIVVFDEASQIKVANAIGALGRAQVAVVVGDSKQMPPSSVFDSALSEDEADETAVVDEESILRECVLANVPRRWLSWHYRSKDETLIAFSNEKYYESRLASFPSPIGASGSGLSLRRVDGTFDRTSRGASARTNAVEADAIVAEIERRYAESPDALPSIGVITLNIQQRDLIRERLLATADPRISATLEDPDNQALWVLNLESVQGKEADLVLFSIAFSKDASGKLPLHFGPMNLPGAERRLNVAVTRARAESIVFCSFEPMELQARQPASLALQHLADFLIRAQGGATAALQSGLRRTTVDRHRDELAAALNAAGFTATTDVGLSDFRVDIALSDPADPDRQLVAVLLDGPGWRDRKTVHDRDGLPISVLSDSMGWPAVERVWLADWMRDRDGVLERLRAAVDRAMTGQPLSASPAATVPVAPSRATAAVASNDPGGRGFAVSPTRARARTAADSMLARHASEYRPWDPEAARSPRYEVDDLPGSREHQEVSAYADQIVAAEGPIAFTRLARLIGDVYGLGRVTAGRQAKILRCVSDAYRRSGDPDFAWPRAIEPANYAGFRVPAPDEVRSVQEIAPEEIANAMAVIAKQSGGATAADLISEALSIFGGRRLTAQARTALEAGLDRGLRSGRLRSDGDLIHPTWHGGSGDVGAAAED
ncbi:hypothetical protein L332_01845 [Agrococcus pavilionensis RW1]|uniref:Uncharacterized protein n=1 Tax=Agrococcus pavilionensis RW1 TaxID=1330458 RepID=U1L8E9_9MICO|nr:DUF4011 domain-containing protein [Agrococcus pavilionensis]ERG63198.1 hypothetical protein L332_01845 [Agrococcus pavilionensis RW1]